MPPRAWRTTFRSTDADQGRDEAAGGLEDLRRADRQEPSRLLDGAHAATCGWTRSIIRGSCRSKHDAGPESTVGRCSAADESLRYTPGVAVASPLVIDGLQ